jgi:hypothetical protein
MSNFTQRDFLEKGGFLERSTRKSVKHNNDKLQLGALISRHIRFQVNYIALTVFMCVLY